MSSPQKQKKVLSADQILQRQYLFSYPLENPVTIPARIRETDQGFFSFTSE